MKKFISVFLALMMILTAAAAASESDFLIVAPNGAPSIAVSGIWAENQDAVKTINADTIADKVL